MMQPVPFWFLTFIHADSVWWHRFLRPGYGHCWAFGYSPASETEAGRWVVFDPAFEGLQVRLAGEAEVAGWFQLNALRAATILRIKPPAHAVRRPRLVVTCAGALAALVGLRETPLTPWRLACIARRYGAEKVTDEQSGQGPGDAAEVAGGGSH